MTLYSSPVIIDTDPGIDDALALSLALASPQLDIKAITVVFGNSSIKDTTRNLLTLFDVIDKEIEYLKNASPHNNDVHPEEWEKERRILLNRFEWSKPVVAIGADKPMKATEHLAVDFHGIDGFGQIHTTHPHYTPKDLKNLKSNRYEMSSRDAIDEILIQLKNSPPFTITIIALGPLTNLALAYEKDKRTFSRVKQIICLGGAINSPGNTTPCAEFNIYADPDAACILTEATKGFSPSVTIQNKIEMLHHRDHVPLHLTVLPINGIHLYIKVFTNHVTSLNTPLSVFVTAFMDYAFNKMRNYYGIYSLEMHDPVAVAFAIDILTNKSPVYTSEFVDMKIETQGIYTRGMTIVDSRPKPPSLNLETLERDFGIWGYLYATNVEIITSYDYKFFIGDFLKRVFNVDFFEY
ncbi:11759_t:CDS:2 [Funneliformis mosseae]|uniref:11759_t:CDS:1 n=1 Tax=Funneliformis mosseae TaxID=27381 RepID=A0A9N9ACZ1_FUNMO|nr:11759_t:CDS:2 [Funneliformis mosseae]